MRTFRSVRGLPVVTLLEGGHAGKLDDFLFSLDTFTVHGFRLRSPGFWSGDTGVAAPEVALLGRDYVLVSREGAIESGSGSQAAGEGRLWWTDLVGTSVMLRRGVELGTVEDVVLDAKPSVVRALLLEGGGVIALHDDVVLGGDSVVLDDETLLTRPAERAESVEWWRAISELLAKKD